jgi:hypothetical protein
MWRSSTLWRFYTQVRHTRCSQCGMTLKLPLASTLVFVTALTWSFPAIARDDADEGGSTTIALDLEYAGDIDEDDIEGGSGGAIRLGRQADLVAITLTGEIGGGYHGFGGDADLRVYRGFLGGRLQVGKILEPGIYGHLGIAKLDVDPGDSRTAPTFDAGLFLDLTVLPLVDVGVHAGYDTVLGTGDANAFDYWVAGAHAALVF